MIGGSRVMWCMGVLSVILALTSASSYKGKGVLAVNSANYTGQSISQSDSRFRRSQLSADSAPYVPQSLSRPRNPPQAEYPGYQHFPRNPLQPQYTRYQNVPQNAPQLQYPGYPFGSKSAPLPQFTRRQYDTQNAPHHHGYQHGRPQYTSQPNYLPGYHQGAIGGPIGSWAGFTGEGLPQSGLLGQPAAVTFEEVQPRSRGTPLARDQVASTQQRAPQQLSTRLYANYQMPPRNYPWYLNLPENLHVLAASAEPFPRDRTFAGPWLRRNPELGRAMGYVYKPDPNNPNVTLVINPNISENERKRQRNHQYWKRQRNNAKRQAKREIIRRQNELLANQVAQGGLPDDEEADDVDDNYEYDDDYVDEEPQDGSTEHTLPEDDVFEAAYKNPTSSNQFNPTSTNQSNPNSSNQSNSNSSNETTNPHDALPDENIFYM